MCNIELTNIMTLNKILNITSKEHILNGNKEKKNTLTLKTHAQTDRQTLTQKINVKKTHPNY